MQGLDLEAADHKGRTALHLAAGEGQCNIIDTLLKAGARVDAADEFRSTPLHAALRRGRAGAAQLLVSWKVNVELCSNTGSLDADLVGMCWNVHGINRVSKTEGLDERCWVSIAA